MAAICAVLSCLSAPTSTTATAPEPAPMTLGSPARARPTVPSVEGPAAVGCTLLGDSVWDPLSLALTPTSAPGLALRGEMDVRVELPIGPVQRAFAHVAQAGIALRGWTPGEAIAVHARAPVVLEGFVIPYASTPLRLVEVEAGQVVVAMTPDGIEGAAPLTGAAPCDHLRLDAQPGGLHEQPGGVPFHEGEETSATLATFPVPLSREPDGPPVATLTGTPPRGVIAFGSTPTERRIAIFTGNATIFGWVPASTVQEGTGPASPPGTGRRGAWTRKPPADVATRRRRCDAPLPVILEVAGERRRVGEVDPGSTVDVEDEGQPFRRLIWPSASMLEGSLLVPASDVELCSPE